jgi:hypothetical protein
MSFTLRTACITFSLDKYIQQQRAIAVLFFPIFRIRICLDTAVRLQFLNKNNCSADRPRHEYSLIRVIPPMHSLCARIHAPRTAHVHEQTPQDRMPFRLYIHWAAPANSASAASAPIGPIEVPHDATCARVRSGVVDFLAAPHLNRPDLRELIEVAVLERDGPAALQAYQASHPVADPAPASEADADPNAARRITFFAGREEVEGNATLRQLAADGRLAKIEMRIELVA